MQRQATASARVRLVAPIRAAIYARVSSDQQAERHTIDSQVEALLARAAADGHEVTDELRFLDDRRSGASLIRPGLERLRDLAAMAAIDVVYVHAPDRLARSYAHQAVLVEEFARAGAEVVFLNRPIGRTPEDTLLLQLQGMFAEYERTRIAERSRRGKRYLAQAGSVSVLSRAPYGYRYVGREAGGGTARFEVAETEAEVVRRIFRWVGEGRVSLSAVCRRLCEAGVPSPTGKARWGRSTVWTLLTNPAYVGRALFGKTASAPWRPPLRPARGRAPVPKRPSRRVPAAPEHRVAIPTPPLVDAALFEGVREQLDENRHRRRQRMVGARYLLQGLLVCQACGRAFCGRWQRCYPRPPAHGYHYYRCTGTERDRVDGQRRCDARAIRVERLDEAVWREVCQLLEDPARVMGEYQRRLQAVRTGPRRPELETVERQLAKLRGGVGRLIDGYAEGLISKAEFEPRLAGLRRRVAGLEAEAAALQDAAEQARSLQLVVGKLETFAALVQDRLDGTDWATRRDVIRTLVRRVEIDGQHVRVVFRVDPGPRDDPASRRIVQHCPGRDDTATTVARVPLGHQVLVEGAEMLAVRGAGGRALAPDPGVAHGKRRVDHPPGRVAQGVSVDVAPARVQQLLVAEAVPADRQALQPGVGAQAVEAEQQPAPHLVAVDRLAGCRGGEGVGEADAQIRLLEQVEQPCHRPAPTEFDLERAQPRRLWLRFERADHDRVPPTRDKADARVARHPAIEPRQRGRHLRPKRFRERPRLGGQAEALVASAPAHGEVGRQVLVRVAEAIGARHPHLLAA